MNRKINIIIINGKPRSGKDTVIGFMNEYCKVNECARFKAYSTIDPVKQVLYRLGWDGIKDDKSRNLLALLKQFWVNSCDGALKYCMDIVWGTVHNEDCEDIVIAFQIREPAEIDKLIDALSPIKLACGLTVSTLFVNRSSTEEEAYGNAADANVGRYAYDDIIVNDGTLEDLHQAVDSYMDNRLGGYKNEE